MDKVVNIVVAGLGGQGVITASDILATAAFISGADVKKSEVHGMSQRGGSVASDVRFGPRVLSPMVPPGEADALVLTAEDQESAFAHLLRPRGLRIAPSLLPAALASGKMANTALLGLLSRGIGLPMDCWHRAIDQVLKPEHRAANRAAFDAARSLP
ncbi:MAG: 2-oxoacid:acceptor oxidoreductase family protein [Planctomycetes bacterium]|nr:2-oxoacid:acceptor oxidoreductase family protein [Planctomycetota bacterium]